MTRLEPQTGAAVPLRAGDVLRIVATEAEQVADVALFSRDDTADAFSPGRTIDYNESLDLRAGSIIYSTSGAELARVVEDSVGVHDMLLSPCSSAMFARRGELNHRSCHENLCLALSAYGIPAARISSTINVFMDVRVGEDRRVRIHPPPSRAGDSFAMVALTDLIAGVTACSSELTNNGVCKSIGYEVQIAGRSLAS